VSRDGALVQGVKVKAGVRAALWTVWLLAVAGVLAGLVWKLVAPRAQIRIDTDGSGYYVDPSPQAYIRADLWFVVISVVVGLAAGALVSRYLRKYPVPAVTGLAVGGLLASIAMWQVGKFLGPLDRAAALNAKPGTIVLDSLDLGAKGLLLVLPLVAVATWLVIDVIVNRRRGGDGPPPDGAPLEDPLAAADPQ
jgi:hypothetical protein